MNFKTIKAMSFDLPEDIIIIIVRFARGIDIYNLLATCTELWYNDLYYKLDKELDEFRCKLFDFRLEKTKRIIGKLAYYGHIEPFIHMKKISKKYFAKACKGGQVDLVEFMIIEHSVDMRYGMRIAIDRGHADLTLLIARFCIDGLNKALTMATEHRQIDIVIMLVENGANNTRSSLELARRYGYIEIAEYLTDKPDEGDFARRMNEGLSLACAGGSERMMALMIGDR